MRPINAVIGRGRTSQSVRSPSRFLGMSRQRKPSAGRPFVGDLVQASLRGMLPVDTLGEEDVPLDLGHVVLGATEQVCASDIL